MALVAAGTLVVLSLLVLVPRRSADAAAERREVERYEQNGAPLALFGGTDLDAGFVGWDLEWVDGGWSPGHVTVEFEVVDASIYHRRVQLVSEADPEPIDCRVAPCEVLGRRPDGRWQVDGVTAEVDPESALAVLQALEAVDAATFAAGT